MPKVQISKREVLEVKADALIVFLFPEQSAEPLLPGGAGKRLGRALAVRRFKAGVGDADVVDIEGPKGALRVVAAGLGKPEEVSAESLHASAAAGMRAAQELAARSIAVLLPPAAGTLEDDRARSRATLEGLLVGTYRFERYKTDEKKLTVQPAKIVLLAGDAAGAAKKVLPGALAVAAANAVARDLVNEPAGQLDPVSYAARVRELFRGTGVKVKVLAGKQLETLKMGALLQVAKGSDVPARVVHLIYSPEGKAKRKVAFVGKGVTFDAGGYNIKGTGNIETMKCDMSGSAAVVGALLAASDLALPVEVHGVIGLVENLVSGKAYKPGDILRSRAGKTVEINNTDAEGRLVLADLLDFVKTTIGPEAMIDLATLTGACVVALGERCSGVMTNDDPLRERVLAAARSAGERMWPLPLFDDYIEQLESPVADLKNTGSRWGGALTAGLFLKQFVGEVPWVHLDIAGPAFLEKEHPFWGIGGSGAGVATLIRFLEDLD